MNPEDRVLVGVIKRKSDLNYALDDQWYRIPQKQMPDGMFMEYLAIFTSGRVFKEKSGGIYFYAKVKGMELKYRRDLLPDEADHPRAGAAYFRVALGEMKVRKSPILNSDRRVISFIYTTWDRFVKAESIGDLYSKSDYLVDRIYYALRNRNMPLERIWSTQKHATDVTLGLNVQCKNGVVTVSTQNNDGTVFLDISEPEDKILAAIRAEIERHGGPLTINIPLEG